MKPIKLLLSSLLLLTLLAACRAAFPTDKFVRPDGAVNWHLIFLNDGRWEGYYAGNLIAFGAFRSEKDQLFIDSDSQCAELGKAEQAVYSWVFEDETLTLQPVGEDGCAARRLLLTGGPFRRAE